MGTEEFVPPSSMTEARERRDKLVSDIEFIQAQLGTTERNDLDTGVPMPYAEYREWRARAKGALAWKNSELRKIKTWIHSQNSQVDVDFGAKIISAAIGLVDNDSEENFLQLVSAVEALRNARREVNA